MLRIECPYCGTRDQDEFRYGGEASRRRPGDPESATEDAWADWLFYRANVKGVQLERWLHAFGCRRWFLLARDTATHAIEATYRMDAPVPGGLPTPEDTVS